MEQVVKAYMQTRVAYDLAKDRLEKRRRLMEEAEQEMIETAQINALENATFDLGEHGSLRIREEKNKAGISGKLLKGCLDTYLEKHGTLTAGDVDDFMESLEDSRRVTKRKRVQLGKGKTNKSDDEDPDPTGDVEFS